MTDRPAHKVIEDQLAYYRDVFEGLGACEQNLAESGSEMLRDARAINARLRESVKKALHEICKVYGDYARDARL